MRRVLKYPLRFIDEPQNLQIPVDSQFVLFGVQEGVPYVWFETPLNPQASYGASDWTFLIVGTGMAISLDYVHQMSVQSGPYVWHLYRRL